MEIGWLRINIGTHIQRRANLDMTLIICLFNATNINVGAFSTILILFLNYTFQSN
jgi:hypothetical protein